MADKVVTFKVVNLDQVNAKLLEMTPIIRRKYAMKALKAGGKVVQRVADQEAPRLAKAKYRKGVLIRKPGTMAAAIKVRSSKDVNRTGDVGVFVNVRPAKGSNRGKYSPNDPFYWRWVHFGAKTVKRPVAFLTNAGRVLDNEALDAIEKELAAGLQKMAQTGD